MAGQGIRLVGRERELDELRVAFEGAKSGTLHAIVLEGEAGIGKTRLVAEGISCGEAGGFEVFQATGDEAEPSRAFGLLIDAFGSDTARRQRLQDALARTALTGPDRRITLIDELVVMLEDATASDPVAIVLDDLHWADPEALGALRALVRRAATLPVALICATRPSPANVDLERLIEAIERTDGRHVVLGPLDEEAVDELVVQLRDEPSQDLRDTVASAGGNPFFVIEVLSAGPDQEPGDRLPDELRRTVLRRVTHLSEDAKTLVRLAALLGPRINAGDLESVLGRTSIELVDVLGEAVKGGILEDRGDALAFRHDIVRGAIYDDMPEPVRKSAHRDVARALVASGAPATRVATHLSLAAEPHDREAIAWLRRAAKEEARRSPAAAADMLAKAAELTDPTDPSFVSIQAMRVQVLSWAGRLGEASRIAMDVLSRIPDGELAADVHASLGESLLSRGHLIEAAEHLETAASAVPASRRALLYSEAGLARLISGQLDRSHQLCDIALTECAGSDDPRARSLATAVKGLLAHLSGDPEAVELCRSAVRIADRDPTGESHRYGIRFFLGFTLSEADRDDEAVSVLRKGIRLDEAHGVSWVLPTYHAALASLFFVRGEWDDAVAELEVAGQLLEDMESSLLGPLAHGLLAYIACRRDDQALTDKQLALGDADLAEAGPQVGIDWMIRTRAALAADEGNNPAAAAILQAAWGMAEAMGIFVAFRFFGPTYVRFALAAGNRDAAAAAADAVELVGRSGRTRALPGIVALCKGMVAGDEALLVQAVETLRLCSRPLDFVIACEEAASVLEANGQPDRAGGLREEALAVHEALGAQRDVRRMSEAMRGPDRRDKRLKASRPVTGWGSLSPTERRVVALVAEGLTNAAIGERMFISHRTVETHLTHVFRKVGLSSRLELAVRAPSELS